MSTEAIQSSFKSANAEFDPDNTGHFGPYGGSYVSETLVHALDELKAAWYRWRKDDDFMARLDSDLAHYVGRPSPVYYAERLTKLAGGARIQSQSDGCTQATKK